MTVNSYLPGTINSFVVLRETPIGYILIDNNSNEYFLHKNECLNHHLKSNENVQAYLYFDNKRRLACTLATPHLTKDEIKFLKVTDVNQDLGVFLDNNISKELLLSFDNLPFNKSLWPIKDALIPVKLKASKTALKAIIDKDMFLKYDGAIKDQVLATITSYEKDDMILVTDNLFKIKVLKSGYMIKRSVGSKILVTITYLGFNDTLGVIDNDRSSFYNEAQKQILSYLYRNPQHRLVSYYNSEITNKLFKLSHKEFKKLLLTLKQQHLLTVVAGKIILKEEIHG